MHYIRVYKNDLSVEVYPMHNAPTPKQIHQAFTVTGNQQGIVTVEDDKGNVTSTDFSPF